MKMEITVTEALELINEIHKQPKDLFEMICLYLRHNRHSVWICGDVTPMMIS